MGHVSMKKAHPAINESWAGERTHLEVRKYGFCYQLWHPVTLGKSRYLCEPQSPYLSKSYNDNNRNTVIIRWDNLSVAVLWPLRCGIGHLSTCNSASNAEESFPMVEIQNQAAGKWNGLFGGRATFGGTFKIPPCGLQTAQLWRYRI